MPFYRVVKPVAKGEWSTRKEPPSDTTNSASTPAGEDRAPDRGTYRWQGAIKPLCFAKPTAIRTRPF